MTDERGVLEIVQRFQRTRLLATRAAQENPNDIRALFGAGVGFRLSGDYAGALVQFQRATTLQPTNHFAWFELGTVLEALGMFAEATAAFRRVVQLSPTYHKGWYALVQIEKQTGEWKIIRDLEALFQGRDDDGWRTLHVGHTLAKLYEDTGDAERSFAWLGKAKLRRRELHPYLPSERERVSEAVLRSLHSLPEDAQGFASGEPIFVCGMPRTGTTLVERILSSHPDVASAGELSNFFQLFKKFSPSRSNAILDEQTLSSGALVDFERLGRCYIESTRPLTGRTPRFIDKAPSNYMIAGTILKALPNARIICLRRHPLDTVLSNYKQIFPIDDRYYDYVYDLGSAAHQFQQFDAILKHLRTSLPPEQFLQLNYDDLVANQEEQTRALLSFCGLPWDARCLEFQKNASGVSTPSAQQVRQAMYTSSTGRWKKYGALLDPAKTVLEQARLI